MKKLTSIIIMFSVMSMLLVGCTNRNDNGERDVYELSIAIDSPENTVTYLFAEKFAQTLDKKTGGRTKTNVYSNGQLGGDAEISEGVQNGNITFAVQNTAPQVNFVPNLAVFDLPNLFANVDEARKVLDGPFFDKMAAEYQKNNLTLLAYADQGFRMMTSNKMVKNTDDFKGQKIRTMENPNHLAYWKALGANPTPMAFSEVYTGLQQGTIDAQENPAEVIVSSKFYEQQKYVIETNHLLHLLSLIASPEIMDRLPDDIEAMVYESADEAKVWARDTADSRLAERFKIIEENGSQVVEVSPELREEMVKRSQPVYDMIRAKVGNELVDDLLNEIQKVK